jgi:F-type H+-transporting ATPase subunit b
VITVLAIPVMQGPERQGTTTAPAKNEHASTGAGGDHGFDPLKPSFGLMFWSSITFILLFILLMKFAWKPILAKVEEREKKIRGDVDGAEKARKDAEATLAKHEAKLAEAAQAARDTIEAARVRAEQAAAGIAAAAKAEAEATLAKARAQIESDKQRAVADIKTAVVELSMAVTREVVKRTAGQEDHATIADDLIRHVNAPMKGAG